MRKLLRPPDLHVAVPAGIGDSLWCLTKIPYLLQIYEADKAVIALCGGPPHRAKPFMERFDFVSSAWYSNKNCVEYDQYTPEGVYNWKSSQPRWENEFDWMLTANRHLEEGRRLEEWLPQFKIDWRIADRFIFSAEEFQFAAKLREKLGPFVVFYYGPEIGNINFGHNRGSLWTPKQWGALAKLCRKSGLAIVVVGASYDRYYLPHVAKYVGDIYDGVGAWEISQTYAVIKQAKFVVSYQSGIGIFSVFLGVPTACFWRPHGDSIDPGGYVSFNENMASAWAPKESLTSGRYLPLIYGKCSPESIMEHAVRNGWLQ